MTADAPVSSTTAEPPVEIGFKAAWDVWREETRFDDLAPEVRAGVRLGFIAGWRARRTMSCEQVGDEHDTSQTARQ